MTAELAPDHVQMSHDRARAIIPLDGTWRFAYTQDVTHAPDTGVPAPVGASWYETTMPVPGYWDDHLERLQLTRFWSRYAVFNPEYRPIRFPMGSGKPADASLPFLLGVGWYRTRFLSRPEWGARTVSLHVGGVAQEAWIWLNGVLLAHHVGHLTPFDCELDDALRDGSNELVIAVSNLRRDRRGTNIRGFAGHAGGITRSVHLVVTEMTSLGEIYVHGSKDLNALNWQVEVHARSDDVGDLRVHWSLLDGPDGVRVAADGDVDVRPGVTTWSSPAEDLQAWSDRDPHLYRMRVELHDPQGIVDVHERPFGLRVMTTQGRRLLLNGSPVFLRGATEHAYFPETTTPPTTDAYWYEAFRKLKDLGFNWVRFHTWTPPPECLTAADEVGMLLQVEAPNGYDQDDMLDILAMCRLHPSVIIYCGGNEVRLNDAMIDQLERSAELVHRLAPDALFSPMEALPGVDHGVDENEPGHTTVPYPHHAPRLKRLESFSDVLAPYADTFSYRSLQGRPETVERRLALHSKPCLIHEMGITDSFIDIGLEWRYAGTRTGSDLFTSAREYLTASGLLNRAGRYHRNSVRWQQIVVKHVIETVRLSGAAAGYDLLGAIDCHWHRSGYGVGIMNEFYELKAGTSAKDVRAYNGETVLLADCGTKRNLLAGTTRNVVLSLSHFGATELRGGRLDWRVVDERGCVVQRGGERVSAQPGEVTKVADVLIDAPVLGRGTRLRLEASVAYGQLQIENAWDFWAFPEVPPAAASDGTKIATEITLDDVAWMESGGRLLLLGPGSFPAVPTTFQIMSGGRTNGSNATVVESQPALGAFPHDGYCDWQFAGMLDGGAAVVFDDLGLPFDPAVEIVSGYKVIRKQSALFEIGVGRGALIVCALRLDEDDPAAQYLLDQLTRRLKSPEVGSATRVPAADLGRAVTLGIEMTLDLTTDEAYDDGGQVHADD